jgi:hypothetical protein
MRRLALSACSLVSLAALFAGCTSTSSTACSGPENTVNICYNGTAIDFGQVKTKPHAHESGDLYAPAEALAKAIGATVELDAAKPAVKLNGQAFLPKVAEGGKGIHVHDGLVYVPVKLFAESAGFKVAMNAEKGIAGIGK